MDQVSRNLLQSLINSGMKKLLIIISIMFVTTWVNAQSYSTGIGIRGGSFSGLSVKHFFSGQDAVEGVVAIHHRGLLLTGLFQRHAMAFDAPGLNWYYGFGAHFGVYERRRTPWFPAHRSGSFSTIGVLGVLGLEYMIQEIPFTVGVDLIPAFNIIGHTGLWPGAGITLRYILN
jgi:hypothetical protein